MTRLPLKRAAIVLLVVGLVLFPLGTVGQEEGGPWPDGPELIGAIGWFGFMLCALLLLVVGVLALVRALTSRGVERRGGATEA